MLFNYLSYLLLWATYVSAIRTDVDLTVRTRNAPGKSSPDTFRALGQALADASIRKRDSVFKNSTSIEKYWENATLFSGEETIANGNTNATALIDVICVGCYVKTKASVLLTVDGNFNTTAAFNNVTEQIGQQFENITTTVVDWVEDYPKNTITNFADGISASDFVPSSIDVDFHINMPEVPETQLSFQFDDMELYVLLETVLSGGVTYNLNFYTSNTPIGVAVSDEVRAGVIFTIDLILSAEGEVNINSGFHIKLDDGVAFDIALFSQNVSDTTFNGGSFEFLPVTIQGANALLTAVLRVGVWAGFDLDPPDADGLDVSAGIMVGVFAHIAEFTTNVTAAPAGVDEKCVLRVEESYQLAIGAVAGATIAIEGHTWGPVPATTVPVFYTAFADVCASTKTSTIATATATTSIKARKDHTTTTLKHTDMYTGVQCSSLGLINCPASLQTTAIASTVRSLVTSVASGVTATWPSSVLFSVPTTIAFGTAAKNLFATSGTPTSYVPPPSSAADDVVDFVNGVDKRIIIGVSAGVGGALVLAVVGCCFFCRRRRKYAVVPTGPLPMVAFPTPVPYHAGYDEAKKTPAVIGVSSY